MSSAEKAFFTALAGNVVTKLHSRLQPQFCLSAQILPLPLSCPNSSEIPTPPWKPKSWERVPRTNVMLCPLSVASDSSVAGDEVITTRELLWPHPQWIYYTGCLLFCLSLVSHLLAHHHCGSYCGKQEKDSSPLDLSHICCSEVCICVCEAWSALLRSFIGISVGKWGDF